MHIILLIVVCIIAAVELLLLFDWLKEITTRQRASKVSRYLRIPWTVLAVFVAACIAYACCVEPTAYTTTYQRINTARLPPDAKLAIALLADLHLEGEAPAVTYIMNTLESYKPDVILLFGQNHNTDAGKQALRNLIAQIDAPLGIYSLAGSAGGLESHVHGSAVYTLAGTARSFDIGSGYINIFGSESSDRESFASDLSHIPQASYTVAFHHSPDMLETAAEAGVDLYLCGHPDGSRIYLPLIGRVRGDNRPAARFGGGLHAEGGTLAYVSRGMGTPDGFLNRFRFRCRPEIVIIEIAGSH